jgi:hypothetical protein
VGDEEHSNVGIIVDTGSKIPIMFSISKVASTSSPLLLDSFVTFDWYEFS